MFVCGYVHVNEGNPWSPEALDLPGARVTYISELLDVDSGI